MSSANRPALIGKTHRVLKKHYKPVAVDTKRTLLEHLLFACCLENSPPDAAARAAAALHDKFYDLNEVRVTTVRELAEVMQGVPDAADAATRVKGVLQSVFEEQYSFDLEGLKKQNIGQAVKRLEKYEGTTPFSVAYVTQVSLGGHAIPVNRGALVGLVAIGVITLAEAQSYKVPGLSRAISKNKGIEFGSLLHQMGVQVGNQPYSPATRKLLLEIAPDCKDRLPKRPSRKQPEPEEVPAQEADAKTSKASEKKPAEPAPPKQAGGSKPSDTKRAAKKKAPAAKPAAAAKKSAAKKSAKAKKPAKAAKKKAAKPTKSKTKSKTKSSGKKSSTKQLARRKPR